MGLAGALDVDAPAMMAFMSTFGAEVMVFQPLTGRAGDSLPLGTRDGGPGAAIRGMSGSSMMNTSSSGMPAAGGRVLKVGRNIGLFGADEFDCLLPRLLVPGGESFGESLNALGLKVGTIACGMS